MANKTATVKTTAAAIENVPEIAQIVEAAPATEVANEEIGAPTETEVVAEKAKRERGYSQSAINTADLLRLNLFKANIKETRGLNVSNQTIIAAALECLATEANMTAFLKSLVTTAADKQRSKDLAAFAALKAKLEAVELNEDSTEELVEASEEAAAAAANEA